METDQQKIHPSPQGGTGAQTTPATAPLMPAGAARSYVVQSKPVRRKCCSACRCFCCAISFLLFLILLAGAVAGVLYLMFKPKLPKFEIDQLEITSFDLRDNSTLYASFNLTLNTSNPNRRIGIYYKTPSLITVSYLRVQLCNGSLPAFYQGHRNTTVLDLTVSGQTEDAGDLLSAMQDKLTLTGSVPFDLRVKQHVRIKIGKLSLPKMKVSVKCRLDFDKLAANNVVSIKNSICKFKFRL